MTRGRWLLQRGQQRISRTVPGLRCFSPSLHSLPVSIPVEWYLGRTCLCWRRDLARPSTGATRRLRFRFGRELFRFRFSYGCGGVRFLPDSIAKEFRHNFHSASKFYISWIAFSFLWSSSVCFLRCEQVLTFPFGINFDVPFLVQG